MNYTSSDFFYLDEQLFALQKTIIEWRGEKAGEYKRVNFFSYTEMVDGVFRYRYDPFLERHIRKSKNIFALLDVRSMGLLKRKNALPLYEVCFRYKPNKEKNFHSGTPWFSLEDVKDLITGKSDSYPEFKEFNRRVLIPSIKEVNTKTNIHVTAEFRKLKRRVVAIKFQVLDNIYCPQTAKPKNLERDVKAMKKGRVEAEYIDDPLFSNHDDKSGAADLSIEGLGDFFTGVNGRRQK